MNYTHMPAPYSSVRGGHGPTPAHQLRGVNTTHTGKYNATNTYRASPFNRTNHSHGPYAVSPQHSDSNLYVRFLPLNFDDTMLLEMFEKFGPVVSSAIMRNIHTGESLGTAFVRFQTHESALRAMMEYHRRPLPAEYAAKETAACLEEDTSENATASGNKNSSYPPNATRNLLAVMWAKRHHDDAIYGEARRKIRKLFVRNVPLDVKEEEVMELMERYGPVDQVTLHFDTANRRSNHHAPQSDIRQIAFIIFQEDGAAAVACSGVHNTYPFHSCEGIPVMAKLAEDNRQRHARRNQQLPSNASHLPNRYHDVHSSQPESHGSSLDDSITSPSTTFRPTPYSTPILRMTGRSSGSDEAVMGPHRVILPVTALYDDASVAAYNASPLPPSVCISSQTLTRSIPADAILERTEGRNLTPVHRHVLNIKPHGCKTSSSAVTPLPHSYSAGKFSAHTDPQNASYHSPFQSGKGLSNPGVVAHKFHGSTPLPADIQDGNVNLGSSTQTLDNVIGDRLIHSEADSVAPMLMAVNSCSSGRSSKARDSANRYRHNPYNLVSVREDVYTSSIL